MMRLAPLMGFSVKVVEREGGALKNQFPQSSLWEGAPCGRPSCVTCNQGSEMIAPCTRKSLLYENICSKCNEGAGGKEEVVGGGYPGWLPTLDTSLKVGSDNKIKYRFYEKETCSQKTVQRRTAMEENVKLKIVSNDLVRRLCNSMEELGSES